MAVKKVAKSELEAVGVLLAEVGIIPLDPSHLSSISDTDENGAAICIEKRCDGLEDRVNDLGVTRSGRCVESEALLEFHLGTLSLRNHATEQRAVVLRIVHTEDLDRVTRAVHRIPQSEINEVRLAICRQETEAVVREG
jgi:hypothetical protein